MSFKLFYRPSENELETDQLMEKANALVEKNDIFLRSIEALLHFLKSFAIDVKELRTDRFKEGIDELNENFASDERPKRIELNFEHEKNKILTFIEHQHSYIEDREKELRDIIELLTKAMANLDVENQEFYQRVHDKSESMEKITLLDDIKKIKTALAYEVSQMREIVDIKKDQDNRQVQLLADQVDILKQELEKTRAKSMSDGLTGVYNRQAFDDTLNGLIERSRVMNNGFSLMLLDLDDFKKVNDTHGHLIGDRVLVAFAQKCRSAVRGDDYVARYGGEEFAILLPGANLKNALNKGRQICDAVAAAKYATSAEQSENYLSVTVSIGVTAFLKKDTMESMIERADKALYKAKRNGKNCAVGKKS